MRAFVAFLVAAALLLTGCVTVPADGGTGRGNADAALKRDVASLRTELNDLRGEIGRLRQEIIRVDARVTVLSHQKPKENDAGAASSEHMRKLLESVKKVSDVHVCWLGEVQGVQFFLCPVTKEEETKIFRDQLGDDYAYMWLTIHNANKAGTGYRFEPRHGLITLKIAPEGEDGSSKFEVSFDPRQVIKVREMQLKTKLALSEHFEAQNVLPGQTVQTHVLMPKSVDFTNVETVYMGSLQMKELKP